MDNTPLTSPCRIASLPLDILNLLADNYLREICDNSTKTIFLNYSKKKDAEERSRKIFRFSYDWRNFINTSKKNFGNWKKESQIIFLSYPYTRLFCNSPEFRQRIISAVESTRQQLELSYDLTYYNTETFSSISLDLMNDVKSIYITQCHVLTPPGLIMNAEEIHLFRSELSNKDFSFASQVRSFSFEQFHAFRLSEKVFDFAPLQHLENGCFSVYLCKNYGCLSNLQSLTISSCASINDVSSFRNIPKLNLPGCDNIMDVSPLANVYDLNLSSCLGITDVSSLGNVHTLNLSNCRNLEDVSALGNVHTLLLSWCNKVVDLSGLHSVYSLTFNCFQGSNLSGLKSVVELIISDSRDVSDVNMLHSLQQLNIERCHQITDITGLTQLKELTIDECTPIQFGLETFQQLTTLRITDYYENILTTAGEIASGTSNLLLYNSDFLFSLPQLETLFFQSKFFQTPIPSVFSQLRQLLIYQCPELPSITLISSLRSLQISCCASLKSICLLHGDNLDYPLYDLWISDCDNLEEIQIHRKVFKFRLKGCRRLNKLGLHHQIAHLNLRNCEELKEIANKSLIISFDEQNASMKLF
jgi:hypothetical protein